MKRTRSTDNSGDEFPPESSLLTIQVRRSSHAAPYGATNPLESAWQAAFDPMTGVSDEDLLKATLGHVWLESFILDRPFGAHYFTIRPIGRLPQHIQELLADGENLPALMEQINHMAMVNCHSVKPTSGLVELDDGYDVTDMKLTLLPLACREGVVNRYLGTLGQ
jgi:hypothetical protein